MARKVSGLSRNGPLVANATKSLVSRPEFHNWSPVSDLLLSSESFANWCLTFYPADVFEIKMKGVFPLTTDGFLDYIRGRIHFLSKMSAFESEK